MVNTYIGEIILWEADEFDYNEMIDKINKNPSYYNMCFLIHNNGKILGAVSALELISKTNIKLICYEIGWDLFERARDFYYSNEALRYLLIPVVDLDGNFAFMLQFMNNKGDYEGQILNYRNYESYDLLKQKDNLDYTVVEEEDCFVFYELEEYSFAITRLIIEKFPNKKIIYLDDRIKYFYDDIEVVDSVYYVSEIVDVRKTLFIKPGGYMAEFPNKIYGSIQVFNSLVWCAKREEFGNLNPDKTILLLDFPTYHSGIGDIAKYIYAYCAIAKKNGWEPVINLSTPPNQYLQSGKENIWDFYFEKMSGTSVEEAYKSKNVIVAKENDFNLVYFENIYMRREFGRINEICLKGGVNNRDIYGELKLNEAALKKITAKIPKEIMNKEKRILGIVARGTDLKPENRIKIGIQALNADIGYVIKRSNYIKETMDCEYIFVATEDSEYFEKIKSAFGEKMLYVDQKRFNTDADEYVRLSERIEKDTDAKEIGYDYLAAVYALSKCDVLISSANCGAYWLAKYWNEGRFEFSEVIKKI